MPVVPVVCVVCVVMLAGVGAGAGAPGVSVCPAKTQIKSVRLRSVAALIRRKVVNLGAS
jgi:hypothetical protein